MHTRISVVSTEAHLLTLNVEHETCEALGDIMTSVMVVRRALTVAGSYFSF